MKHLVTALVFVLSFATQGFAADMWQAEGGKLLYPAHPVQEASWQADGLKLMYPARMQTAKAESWLAEGGALYYPATMQSASRAAAAIGVSGRAGVDVMDDDAPAHTWRASEGKLYFSLGAKTIRSSIDAPSAAAEQGA